MAAEGQRLWLFLLQTGREAREEKFVGADTLKRVPLPPGQLWLAPELLRGPESLRSQEADIYAFAIICSEIVTRKGVYDLENRDEKVEGASIGCPFALTRI